MSYFKNNGFAFFLSSFTFIFLIANFSFSQTDTPEDSIKIKKIQILHADIIDYDEKNLGKDIKRLKGNVEFMHDSVKMYCDSAYFNSGKNFIQAFNNIHINQGDSIHLYGDSLVYDGNIKKAKIRKNVKLTNDSAVLTTDSMNFDRVENTAYYFNYGKMVDGKNSLESDRGYYFVENKDFVAVDSVILHNPDYDMFSDSLRYNITSRISYFFGPTTIVSDSNLLYCENGWYDTRHDVAQFNRNAYYTNQKQSIKGDSLYYNRKIGFGKAFKNVTLTDSTENITITGHYGVYYENPEHSLVTDSAVFMQISEGDTMFLHGDSLKYKTISDTIQKIKHLDINNKLEEKYKVIDTIYVPDDTVLYSIDSTLVDSVWVKDSVIIKPTDSLVVTYDSIYKFKLLRAYYKVKIYRNDIQAKCDSLVYSLRDSVIEMHYEPVIWSDKNQLTATYIELHTKNNHPDYIILDAEAFIISRKDSIRFNQIKGKRMIGYFKDDTLRKVNVTGNGQSIYFATEKDKRDKLEKLIGVNKVNCTDMIIYLKDSEPEKIVFLKNPDGVMNPVHKLSPSELKLENFVWLIEHRPLKPDDIFKWN
ncbi:MAG: OstA-like protein [Marinilabiliales bacterium]